MLDFTKIHLLSDANHINDVSEKLVGISDLGLDTEFVRERTFFPKPGLIQLSDGESVWLLDPVAPESEPALGEVLGAVLKCESTVKILHSLGEDLEVLDLLTGAMPWPLFDTQRAAAMLGFPLQIRYETLALELMDQEFPGGLGRNDWTRRPLPHDWIEYASHDVIALPDMRALLSERLREAGRLEWLEEDCARALERYRSSDAPVMRVKGAANLDDRELERLNRLAEWREQRARDKNLPRGFIAPDGLLLALARDPSLNIVETARATPPNRVPGAELRREMIAVLGEPEAEFTRPAELVAIDRDQRAEIKALQGKVREAAAEIDVEPALLASRRDLTRLLLTGQTDWLDGWRGEVLGTGFW